MKEELKIALFQTDLEWENPSQNRVSFTEKIQNIKEEVDMVILPEMFTSGFTMNAAKVAETMEGETVNWMRALSKQIDAAIVGSVVITENNNYYNRFLFVKPNGSISYYDKRHTFTFAGEDKVYAKGRNVLLVDYRGWSICPLICYDLRFPVWARNTKDYDVLLFVANWPEPRINAWDALLRARAIENMSYCVGVNRVGTDGKNISYNGSSAVYDTLGNKITTIPLNNEVVKIVTLEKAHITENRQKFRFLDDRDNFNLLV